MLIHLTPQYFLRYSDVIVDVIDISIPEMGLLLVGNKDIVVRTPFPNKNYKVVCRKKGEMAVNGIFIETAKPVQFFSVVTRWAVNGEISLHKVHYSIEDLKYDAASADINIWNGFSGTNFEMRRPKTAEKFCFTKDQPQMVTLEIDNESSRDDAIFNVLDDANYVRQRTEYFEIPSIEKERLIEPMWFNNLLPMIEHAFHTDKYTERNALVPSRFKDFGINAVQLSDWVNELEKDKDNTDTVAIKILKEILLFENHFFTNTNDLIIKARLFSPLYSELTTEQRAEVEIYLNQPIFHVFIIEEDEG